MAFRVLVIGGPPSTTYASLRATLDALLVHRLPDVTILTAGGPGLPALAASYARSRNLELFALTPDYARHRGDALDRRDAALVAAADAVVVAGVPDADARDVIAHARQKGVPIHLMIAKAVGRRGAGEPADPQGPTTLPD